MKSAKLFFALLLTFSTALAQAAMDWTVRVDPSDRIREARERLAQTDWDEADDLVARQIQADLERQGRSSEVTIRRVDDRKLFLRNSPDANQALRLGVDEEDIDRFYLLSVRDSFTRRPDFKKQAGLIRVTFSFGSGEPLRLKKISSRLFFEEKDRAED